MTTKVKAITSQPKAVQTKNGQICRHLARPKTGLSQRSLHTALSKLKHDF